MRRAARTDDNHAEIVAALRGCGCLVQSLAAVGKGVPDLLVQRNDVLYLLEVKDGNKPPSRRLLTPEQEKFLAAGWRFHVVSHPFEALHAVGLRKG